jgi:hypothetical protein
MANRTAALTALQDAGVAISEEELDARIAAAIRDILGQSRLESHEPEFSSQDRAILSEGGFDLSPRRPGEANPALLAAERYAALLASALTVTEAARRLGVDGSRIRQRLLARQLFGIRRRSGWLLPRFQFTDRGLVPGIERVLPHLPAGLHPLVVAAWFATPHPDLTLPGDTTEAAAPPREWLLAGGDPESAANLAEDAAGYA